VPDWLINLRLPPFGWRNVLDLTIVSLAVYEVLKAIRGTRAVQMALGTAVFVLVYYVSQWGQLETVNWLIRNAAAYIAFAIIVLFQADIRRALAHLGRAPVFRYFLGAESGKEAIEEMVVAATMLGSQRIGAIIVIERQIGLRNYTESGISLDATLTYSLLMSIFRRESPLHDGAVIVQRDRITAAGCFLPLTVNPQLSRTLGTRHRAAIGLTEENDAVAIVVSEETGNVSLALDGHVEQALSPDRLRTRLHELLRRPRHESERREARAV